jgi:hypothetical protein
MGVTYSGTNAALTVNQQGTGKLFEVQDGGVARMTMLDGGNVGIGVTNPGQKLHVVGDARIEGNLTVNGTQTFVNTTVDVTSQLEITNDGTGPALVVNQTGAQPILDFRDDGVSVMKIIDGGNVGIGSTFGASLPTERLHVLGNVLASGTVTGSSFAGIGSSLTALNAGNISTGTLAVARGGTGTTTSTGTGSVVLSASPTLTGTVTGGTFVGIGSSLTALNVDNVSTGTLAVARGGTGAATLTAGKVLVGNGTGVVTQPTNLHWDNTNSRLGIRTSAPALSAMHVYGDYASGTYLLIEKGGVESWSSTSGYDNTRYIQCKGNAEQAKDFNVGPGGVGIGYAPPIYTTGGQHALYCNGSVGIGTTNPQSSLHVWGVGRFTGLLYVQTSDADNLLTLHSDSGTGLPGDVGSTISFRNRWWSGDTGTPRQAGIRFIKTQGNGSFGGGIQLCSTNSSEVLNPVLTTTHLNYVGIGKTNPQHPLDVGFSANTSSMGGRYMDFTAAGSFYTGEWGVSIKANNWIWATTGFVASSDTRIKTNIQDIDDGVALSQLRLLKPKTYEYIDKVQRGADPVIGFIAQEVAEVLPRAVTKKTEIIPFIYAVASVVNGIIQLDKAHDLVIGDKVKMIKEQGAELVTTVNEVVSDTSFTIADEILDARVFVYGKEVKDFHTLDKNAIFTIGIAAMQEIDRTMQALIERVAILESKR